MKDCSPTKVAKYKGIRKPTCNGGKGCDACWHKYYVRMHQKDAELIDKMLFYAP